MEQESEVDLKSEQLQLLQFFPQEPDTLLDQRQNHSLEALVPPVEQVLFLT